MFDWIAKDAEKESKKSRQTRLIEKTLGVEE
jgi:hypothetical protein